MAFLIPDKIEEIYFGGKKIRIRKKIIPNELRATKYVARWCREGDPMKPCALLNDKSGNPRAITVHNTGAIKAAAGTTMGEQYSRATYNGNMGGTIVSFYVSGYDDIWQLLETTPGKAEQGWHATDLDTRTFANKGATYRMVGGNVDTISIECIGPGEEAEDATARLCAYLCKQHGLNPLVDVYPHKFFYPVKNCPAYILPHWDKFIAKVETYYAIEKGERAELYRVGTAWENGKCVGQRGAFSYLENAKKFCRHGEKVFDSEGKVVFERPPLTLKNILKELNEPWRMNTRE